MRISRRASQDRKFGSTHPIYEHVMSKGQADPVINNSTYAQHSAATFVLAHLQCNVHGHHGTLGMHLPEAGKHTMHSPFDHPDRHAGHMSQTKRCQNAVPHSMQRNSTNHRSGDFGVTPGAQASATRQAPRPAKAQQLIT
jgi:hypothetical protein